MKKLTLIFLCCCLFTTAAYSRTNWRLYVGGMYAKSWSYDNAYDASTFSKESGYTIWAGMDIQFIIKEKFHIETGLNYRRAPYGQWGDGFCNDGETRVLNAGDNNWISVPLRFAYRLPINEENSFEFGVGPYVSMAFERGDYDPLSVGISPVVTFKHRALSLSFRYENPVFYDGLKNNLKNQFAFTIGVNFNGRKPNWDNVLIGLEAANAVLSSTTETMNAYSNAQASYSEGGYSESSSYSTSNSKSSSGNGFSLSEQNSYNNDKRTYERYDSQLASHFAGNQTMSSSSVRNAQSQMKKLRKKWEKKGKSFPHSANEDR